MRFFPKLLQIKFHFLMPVIMLICYIGAYSDTNSIFTLGLLLFCGFLGFLLSWANLPISTLILAYILSPLLETQLRRGLSFSRLGPWEFFTRPLSATLILISVVSVIYAFLKPTIRARKAAKAAGSNIVGN